MVSLPERDLHKMMRSFYQIIPIQLKQIAIVRFIHAFVGMIFY